MSQIMWHNFTKWLQWPRSEQ